MSIPLAVRIEGVKNLADLIPVNRNCVYVRYRAKIGSAGQQNFTPTAATTGNIDLAVPGGLLVEAVHMSLITAFSGGSVSAATLSVGTTGSPATYLAATNVFTGATAGGAVTIGSGAGLGNYAGGNSTPTAVGTIRIQLITTTANLSALTAGAADIFLRLRATTVRTS